MGTDSKIEWTRHTFNPWRGCTKISSGCTNCYADAMSMRNPRVLGEWGPNGTRIVAGDAYWRQAEKWDAAAYNVGERHRVFCASLADVFEGADTMPPVAWTAVAHARIRLFALIENTPNLDWLLLTKRPQHVMSLVPETWRAGFPQNVWMGTSVEDQHAADERIPALLEIPARGRFLSMEPLLGPVDLQLDAAWLESDCYQLYERLHWIIVGGESGANARPMHPDWARSIRDQCQNTGVPFFFKQWGEWAPLDQFETEPVDYNKRQYTFSDSAFSGTTVTRAGKKAAGRELDGQEWDDFPV